MWFIQKNKHTLPSKENALKGRIEAINPNGRNKITGNPLNGPHPAAIESLILGMGCFWGAERLFWKVDGVYQTSVGYAGGHTPNPTYQEVCSGQTGHAEVVEILYNPKKVELRQLLRLFWEQHDPTQGMRQGNDVGTQYRSVLYWSTDEQAQWIQESARCFDQALNENSMECTDTMITTTLGPVPTYYLAEEEHQQYLFTHPNGYCGLRGTGVLCRL